MKDPAVSPLLPPAAGPLLALYRIYLAKSGISAAVSYKNILKLVVSEIQVFMVVSLLLLIAGKELKRLTRLLLCASLFVCHFRI